MTDTVTALYRKHRPLTFDAVRNQEHIVSVLKGAIAKGEVPHALLFIGSRGTGKTTVARIFAREIGTHEHDLYEIDAASNRGIDDIRELKESVHTLPFESRYKVYIIDEVHMLTKEAFNALLKTLEEPPRHVVFILATTERDKLPDTIVSRCQTFTFRSPTRAELKELVLAVAREEHCTLKPASADVIAIAADSSYRDALGILQKVMLASGDTVLSADEVATIVGAPKNALLLQLLTACIRKDIPSGLGAIREAEQSSVDMKLFLRLFLERVRSVLIMRYEPAQIEVLLSEYDDETAVVLKGAIPETIINSRLVTRLITAREQMNYCDTIALPLEVALIDHCSS